MAKLRSYPVHKSFDLYLPLEEDLIRRTDGGFHVHVPLLPPAPSKVEFVAIPDCAAANMEEAMGLSMTNAMRPVDDGHRGPPRPQRGIS